MAGGVDIPPLRAGMSTLGPHGGIFEAGLTEGGGVINLSYCDGSLLWYANIWLTALYVAFLPPALRIMETLWGQPRPEPGTQSKCVCGGETPSRGEGSTVCPVAQGHTGAPQYPVCRGARRSPQLTAVCQLPTGEGLGLGGETPEVTEKIQT